MISNIGIISDIGTIVIGAVFTFLAVNGGLILKHAETRKQLRIPAMALFVRVTFAIVGVMFVAAGILSLINR